MIAVFGPMERNTTGTVMVAVFGSMERNTTGTVFNTIPVHVIALSQDAPN